MAPQKSDKKRMSQSEIYKHFALSKGMKKAEVKALFDQMSALAAREVKSNREFVLPGFGKLVRSQRKARTGRNPLTGDTIQIPSKSVLKFRLSKDMKVLAFGDSAMRPDYRKPKNQRPSGDSVTRPGY